MGIHDALDWTIREAGPDDAGALALVAQATFLETYAGLTRVDDMLAYCAHHYSTAGFAGAFGEGARGWIAQAKATQAPLGFAMLTRPDLAIAGPGDAELKRLYVLDRCQGQGLAAALLEQVLRASAGRSRLLLGVNRDNLRAQAFYRKHGFALAGTRTFTVGATAFDDLVFAKPLETA